MILLLVGGLVSRPTLRGPTLRREPIIAIVGGGFVYSLCGLAVTHGNEAAR